MRKSSFRLQTVAYMATGAVLLFKSMASLAAPPFDGGEDAGSVRIVAPTDNSQCICLLNERSPRRVRQNADRDRSAAVHSDCPLSGSL